jgi:uncharacterized protein YjlB
MSVHPPDNEMSQAVISMTDIQDKMHSPVTRVVAPTAFIFSDDGLVPNNALPFLVYKNAIAVDNSHPEKTIEGLFGSHGWGGMWRSTVYPFLHYHGTVHEVLAVARGKGSIRFGGDHGETMDLLKGDVAILPAGTGHQNLGASDDFMVVGAYPPGSEMHITRPTPEAYRKALETIPKVTLPKTDPVYGEDGPLMRLWTPAAMKATHP